MAVEMFRGPDHMAIRTGCDGAALTALRAGRLGFLGQSVAATVGGASLVRKHIDEWPVCPQCRGHRSIKDATGVHLCPTCHGTPGPTLSHIELVGQIRTESMLLSGQQRSWAGQIIADAGATLRELDPAELAATYVVDPARPLWRMGVWVADPNAPKPAPPADAPDGAPQNGAPSGGSALPPGKRTG